MTQIATVIGRNLAAIRKKQGLTQAAVAERIDVDAETISRFERGTVTPGIGTLERLCSVLGCSWTDILEGTSSDAQQLGPDIARALAPLSAVDRQFILSQVKVWAEHLQKHK
jgi:transcriptional regulator with XRE-family HTH domain